MRIFVAGGTGHIGRHLVPLLVANGHEVVATTRSEPKVGRLRDMGAEAVVVDGLDADAVGAAVAVAEPEVVVHEMTSLAGVSDVKHFDRTFATTNQLRTSGTDHLLAAATAAGARRFVAQSYTGWPNVRSGGPVKTEADPLDPAPPRAQRRSIAAIRHVEQVVPATAAMEGVVLRYGSFYGPGVSDELLDLVAKRRMPIVGGGTGIWSFLHVADAAAATVAAVEGNAVGVYNVVDDDPAPVSEWLPALAEAVGAGPPRALPSWVARPVVGEVGLSMMMRIRGSSNTEAKRALGWQPWWPSWRKGFRNGLGEPASSLDTPA